MGFNEVDWEFVGIGVCYVGSDLIFVMVFV